MKQTITKSELLLALHAEPSLTQRELAGQLGLSLGLVNRSLKELRQEGLLSEDGSLTGEAVRQLEERKPRASDPPAACSRRAGDHGRHRLSEGTV